MHSTSLGEILFNWSQPEEPPDFIFGPDDTDFEPDAEKLPVNMLVYFFVLSDSINSAEKYPEILQRNRRVS